MFKIDKKGQKNNESNKKDFELECLESVVFNQPDIKKFKKTKLKESDKDVDDNLSFIIDTKGDECLLKKEDQPKSAWQDEDDEIGFEEVFKDKKRIPKKFSRDSKYKDYLEQKFKTLNPVPKWLDNKEEIDSDDDELVRTAGDLVTKKFDLESGELIHKDCTRINKYDDIRGYVVSSCFHPFEKVALVASPKEIKIFNVDELENEKLKEIKFEHYGIAQANFSVDGTEVLISNKWKPGFFYYYHIESDEVIKVPLYRDKEALKFSNFSLSNDGNYIAGCGSRNRIHLAHFKTKEIICDLKINSDTVATAFSPDSNKLFVHSSEGKVYVFDLRKNNRCMHRFVDEGCVEGTSIEISPNQQYIACGSDSGIVNVYDYGETFTTIEPKPQKSIVNLVTKINKVKFNHNSEILAIASDEKENAFKCVHIPTFKIFSNIPKYKLNYGTVTDISFSPNSYYLSIANTRGQVNLLRLLHYQNY